VPVTGAPRGSADRAGVLSEWVHRSARLLAATRPVGFNPCNLAGAPATWRHPGGSM